MALSLMRRPCVQCSILGQQQERCIGALRVPRALQPDRVELQRREGSVHDSKDRSRRHWTSRLRVILELVSQKAPSDAQKAVADYAIVPSDISTHYSGNPLLRVVNQCLSIRS